MFYPFALSNIISNGCNKTTTLIFSLRNAKIIKLQTNLPTQKIRFYCMQSRVAFVSEVFKLVFAKHQASRYNLLTGRPEKCGLNVLPQYIWVCQLYLIGIFIENNFSRIRDDAFHCHDRRKDGKGNVYLFLKNIKYLYASLIDNKNNNLHP